MVLYDQLKPAKRVRKSKTNAAGTHLRAKDDLSMPSKSRIISLHDLCRYRFLLIAKSRDESIITKNIEDPGDTLVLY